MKILFYCDSNIYGGAEKYVGMLSSSLVKLGYQVSLIINPRMLSSLALDPAIRIYPLSLNKSILDLGYSRSIREIIKKTQPDVFHVNLSGVYGAIPIPFLEIDHKTKLIATIHSYELPRSKYPIVGPIRRLLSKMILEKIRKFIIVSNFSKNEFCQLHSLPLDKVAVVYNGLENKIDHNNNNNDPERTERIIGLTSRLNRSKGVENFLKAARILSDRGMIAKYPILGDGPIKQKLQKLARNLRVNVDFFGHVANVNEHINSFDVAVFTSDFDYFPYTILEYMKAGKPIVATKVGGIPEMVRDQREALLVPPKNPQALADSIESLLDNQQLAYNLGKNAQARQTKLFTMKSMLEETINVYRSTD